MGALEPGDFQPQLEAGPPPRQPADEVAEARPGQCLAVGRRGEGDAGIGVQMINMREVEQPVHGRVDGRRGRGFAMQAVVERGDHLVLALDSRVDAGQRAEPVQP